MRTLPIMLLLTLTAFCSCVKEGGESTKTENYIVVGDNMPGFVIENAAGSFKSPDNFTGKKTLLAFFVAGCKDCRREMPFVEYARSELSAAGLSVVAIERGNTPVDVAEPWTQMGLWADRYVDTDRSVFNLFANQTVPRLYLVDETGKVVWMAVEKLGYGEFTEAKGDKFITRIKNQFKL